MAQAADNSSPKPKSSAAALQYSLLGTLIPAAKGGLLMLTAGGNGSNEAALVGGGILGGLGLIFGPGMGHAYAGDNSRFIKGAGLRSIGAAVVGLRVFAVVVADDPYIGSGNPSGGIFPIVAGGGLIVYSAVRDIAGVDDAVERYNAGLEAASLSVAPAWFPEQGAVGICFSVTY